MSEHSKILEKYEKMFEDGSAYQPIHIKQPTPEDVANVASQAEEVPAQPLGEQIPREEFMDNEHTDYSHFDETMANRVNEIRSKQTGIPHDNTQPVKMQNNGDYTKLEKRIELLEQALTLVMETQTKLIKESK